MWVFDMTVGFDLGEGKRRIKVWKKKAPGFGHCKSYRELARVYGQETQAINVNCQTINIGSCQGLRDYNI